ncbi:hypothetical protein [Paracholeplasma brassicae]|nr:hypothetical protein [Paracholeplasma brassicae]
MFKKLLVGVLSVMSMVTLASCAQEEASVVQSVSLSSKESMSFSTYLGTSFLAAGTNQTVSTKEVRLRSFTQSDTLTLESELDEVNEYFDKLKVFMDQGVDNVLNVSEVPSTREGYDFEVTYNIDGLTYTIYYSMVTEEVLPEEAVTTDETDPVVEENDDDALVEEDDDDDIDEIDDDAVVEEDDDDDIDEIDDEQFFEINGLIVIDGVEFILEGAREIEDDEVKTWFKTQDFNRSGDYVHVISKVEDDEQKFDIRTSVNGVETRTRIKFEQDDEETEVDLRVENGETESRYKFKKETEDGVTFYKFQYEIGNVKGQVKVFETTDELGNVTYTYKVQENGKQKDIERGGRHHEHDDHEDKGNRP